MKGLIVHVESKATKGRDIIGKGQLKTETVENLQWLVRVSPSNRNRLGCPDGFLGSVVGNFPREKCNLG